MAKIWEENSTEQFDNTKEVTPETDPEDLMETAKLRERVRIATILIDKGQTKIAEEILKG